METLTFMIPSPLGATLIENMPIFKRLSIIGKISKHVNNSLCIFTASYVRQHARKRKEGQLFLSEKSCARSGLRLTALKLGKRGLGWTVQLASSHCSIVLLRKKYYR